MAKYIYKSPLGGVEENVILSLGGAVWEKFYHWVRKLYHVVMLKMIL